MNDTHYTEFSPNFDPSKVRSRKTEGENAIRRATFSFKKRVFNLNSALGVILPILSVVFVLGAISNMSRNWELERQADSKKRQIAILEIEVEQLKLENEYYASEEFQELAARRLQNKQFEGETLVYLPANTPEAKTKHSEPTYAQRLAASELSNLDQWILFLFGGV